MKIRTISDVENFKKVLSTCEGSVWIESIYGDRYNLKSELSQYLAIAALIKDKNEVLELFAQLPEDQARLMKFMSTLES